MHSKISRSILLFNPSPCIKFKPNSLPSLLKICRFCTSQPLWKPKPILHQRVANSKTKWKLFSDDGSVRITHSTEGSRTPPCVDSKNTALHESPLSRSKSTLRLFQSRLVRIFFPKGYPETVPDNFMEYCGWQALQMSSGAASGVLSMQALLYAVGLGAGSIPLAAALNWIIKDGLGQLGGVLYASLVNSKFDSDPKFHRFYAIALLQFSTFIEICTPLFPGFFLPLAAASNIGKNIAWLASSATRAQMHLSFAQMDNLGDVTAKIASQSIASTLIGTGIAVIASPLIGTDPSCIMMAFVPLSALTLYANYRSVCVVRVETLNEQRAELIFHDYITEDPGGVIPAKIGLPEIQNPQLFLEALEKYSSEADASPRQKSGHVDELHKMQLKSPKDVGAIEKFVLPYASLFSVPLIMEPLIDRLDLPPPHRVDLLHELIAPPGFVIKEHYSIRVITDGIATYKVQLWFHSGLSSYDRLQGFFHSCLLRHLLQWMPLALEPSHFTRQECAASPALFQLRSQIHSLIHLSHDYTLDVFPTVFSLLKEAHWSLHNVFLGEQGARLHLVKPHKSNGHVVES